jgi:RNA polymerase sigma factor (sigma-70 family)
MARCIKKGMSALTQYFHDSISSQRALSPGIVVMNKLDGNALIRSLQQGDSRALDQLYDRYRDEYLAWISKQFRGMDREDFIDAWQETIIAFYDQVMAHRLTELTCDIKTYLFTIGRRYIIKQSAKAKRTDYVDPVEGKFKQVSDSIQFDWDDPDAEKKDLVAEAFKQIGDQCRIILLMRFAEGLAVPVIMEKSGYPNLNTVSATLSRCLRKLKDMIQDKLQSRPS